MSMSGYNMFAAKPDDEELESDTETEMPDTDADMSEADTPTMNVAMSEEDVPSVETEMAEADSYEGHVEAAADAGHEGYDDEPAQAEMSDDDDDELDAFADEGSGDVTAEVASFEDEPFESEPYRAAAEPLSAPRIDEASRPRRPRVCLMGEFSAGKSTLSNLLIGAAALPVNVTATQLPPVWISQGDETPFRVGLDGQEFDIDLNRLSEVSVEDTSHIRIFRQSRFLEVCDLIDMPGISDPNMAAEVWQRVIHHADIVLWCTHATQAWRQSEAATWATMPAELQKRSFLLLTRMDKILSDRDRDRVIRRIAKETRGLFRNVFPVSLLQAVKAGDDSEKWQASGAADLSDALYAMIEEIAGESTTRNASAMSGETDQTDRTPRVVLPTRIRPRTLTARLPSRHTTRSRDGTTAPF
jgi:Dynamin family